MVEIKDMYLESENNPNPVYISEAFGYCSVTSVPFDDMEYIMPFLMNKEKGEFYG